VHPTLHDWVREDREGLAISLHDWVREDREELATSLHDGCQTERNAGCNLAWLGKWGKKKAGHIPAWLGKKRANVRKRAKNEQKKSAESQTERRAGHIWPARLSVWFWALFFRPFFSCFRTFALFTIWPSLLSVWLWALFFRFFFAHSQCAKKSENAGLGNRSLQKSERAIALFCRSFEKSEWAIAFFRSFQKCDEKSDGSFALSKRAKERKWAKNERFSKSLNFRSKKERSLIFKMSECLTLEAMNTKIDSLYNNLTFFASCVMIPNT